MKSLIAIDNENLFELQYLKQSQGHKPRIKNLKLN